MHERFKIFYIVVPLWFKLLLFFADSHPAVRLCFSSVKVLSLTLSFPNMCAFIFFSLPLCQNCRSPNSSHPRCSPRLRGKKHTSTAHNHDCQLRWLIELCDPCGQRPLRDFGPQRRQRGRRSSSGRGRRRRRRPPRGPLHQEAPEALCAQSIPPRENRQGQAERPQRKSKAEVSLSSSFLTKALTSSTPPDFQSRGPSGRMSAGDSQQEDGDLQV